MRRVRPSICHSWRLLAWGTLLCLGLFPTARGEESASVAQSDARARLNSRFQLGLDRMVDKQGLPGATAAFVFSDGQLAAFAVGLADKEQQIAMTPNKRMPAGSVGKTFVAATVLSMVQDGKLGLDDKVEKWLGKEPWFADLPNGHELTVRQLLMHRGGLIDHANAPRFALKVREQIASPGSDPDFFFEPAELVEFALKQKPLFAAGSGYRYTDTGYILVGMIIERAAGSTYYEQLQERFLSPLALNLTVPANRRDIPDLANGYLLPNNPLGLPENTLLDCKLRFNPANEWTGGGLVSNPQDLVRWAKALYEGRAMRQAYLEELLRTAPEESKKPSRYGLGVFVTDTDLGTFYGHGGFFPGYLTYLAYAPKQRVAIAFQFNCDQPKETARTAMFELIADVLEVAGTVD